MKGPKTILLSIAVCIPMHGSLYAYTQTEVEFISRYSVDPALKNILDQHAYEIEDKLDKLAHRGLKEHATWQFDWLPGYYVKYNLSRIRGMERIKRCIEENNLDLLGVPDKRIYHVKGRPEILDNRNYVVVIKAIETDPAFQVLSLRHVQQLATLMRKSTYISMTATNYIRTHNNKLIIIDTESTFDKKLLLSKGFMRLISAFHDINKDYTQEALEFVLNQMAYMLATRRRPERNNLYKEIMRHLRRPKEAQWNYIEFFEKSYKQALSVRR